MLEATKGPSFKSGVVVVAGILGCEEVLEVLADRGRPVHAFDTSHSRVDSVLGKMPAFRMPREIRGVTYHMDDDTPLEKDVGTLILLRDVPLPCFNLIHGSTIVGEAPLLREALKGRKFFPRAAWQSFAALEIA